MATDSAELTFVRCRSCGALVPATATKCRICNAALDGASKLDEGGDSRGGSRVRQRTMSAPSGDLMEAVQKLRDEEPLDGGDDTGSAPSLDADAADPLGSTDDDPLGAYLEEVDDGSSAAMGSGSSDSSDDDDDLDSDDPLGIDDEDDAPKPFAPSQESSRDPGSRPFALGAGSEESDEPPAVKKPVSPFVRPGADESRRGSRFDRPGSRDKREDTRGKAPKPGRAEDSRGSTPVRPAIQTPPPSPVTKHSPVIQTSAARGRLVGWLVSYADTEGTAIDMREGKYFVTGSSFKGTDLVVDDESVSTPHALLSVTLDNGIRVQDLMSEHGLFCKSNGASDFQRTEGPVTLQHGDWVKFGSVEFLVCTVARADAK